MEQLLALIPEVSQLLMAETPRQKGAAIWLFGLSGAGKTTIASLLEKKLSDQGFVVGLLDGDALRQSVNKDLGFSEADRAENVRRAAEIAKMLVNKNIIAICSFITPLQLHRKIAASILADRYLDVFVDCPLWLCEQRDVKGLYKKARNRQIKEFTGVDSRFEAATDCWLKLDTERDTEEEATSILFTAVQPHIVSLFT